jgi:drug/metabolite transporter (DMT)-like permease
MERPKGRESETGMVIKTVLALAAGVVSVSFAAIFIRFCGDVPAVIIATWRLVIASAILLPYAAARGVRLRSLDRRTLLQGALAGFFLALHFITWITSLKYTSVASSVVLVTTNPIFVGIFSWIFLREKQPRALLAGIALSLAGSVILALGDSGFRGLVPYGPGAIVGDALALAGAVMASGYLVVGSRLRERVDLLTHISVVYPFAAFFLLLASLGSGHPFTGYHTSSYIFMFLLAVVPQLVGHTAFNWALKHVRASMVAITILGEPIGASILAWLFFGEVVGPWQFAGMVLIFAAILVAAPRGTKEAAEPL